MAEESGLVKLVNAILLSSLKKGATEIRIHRAGDASVVEFVIGGELREELRPPLRLHAPIVRRLGVMASLPIYGKGHYAEGRIAIRIAGAREASFAIHTEGHGDRVRAWLRVISDEPVPTTP